MPYAYITQHDSPNFTAHENVPSVYGGARTVDALTVHHWDDPAKKPTFDGTVNWLCRRGGKTSAHEVIEAGRVAVIVNHLDAAWHAGNGTGNRTTIGLELSPYATDGDYATAARRIADLRDFYGKRLPLYPHSHWKNTACPGAWNLDRLDRLADQYQAGTAPAKPTKPAPVPAATTAKRWPSVALKLTDSHTTESHDAWVKLMADIGYKDARLTTAMQRWLRHHGLYRGTIDGKFGPVTVKALQRFLQSRGHLPNGAWYADGWRGPATVRAEIKYLNSQRRYY